jgi:large subunit ribosomal protein L12
MEYIYSVMLLNSLGKQVDEANIKKVLEAAGATVDEAKIKSVVAALDGVDIANVIKDAQVSFATAPTGISASSGVAPAQEKKEEKKEEDKPSTEDAAAGLGSLF